MSVGRNQVALDNNLNVHVKQGDYKTAAELIENGADVKNTQCEPTLWEDSITTGNLKRTLFLLHYIKFEDVKSEDRLIIFLTIADSGRAFNFDKLIADAKVEFKNSRDFDYLAEFLHKFSKIVADGAQSAYSLVSDKPFWFKLKSIGSYASLRLYRDQWVARAKTDYFKLLSEGLASEAKVEPAEVQTEPEVKAESSVQAPRYLPIARPVIAPPVIAPAQAESAGQSWASYLYNGAYHMLWSKGKNAEAVAQAAPTVQTESAPRP
jgi:hypothetical protein